MLDDLTIILLDGCEEFEILLILFFKTVLFFSIRTGLLYRYRFLVFVPIPYIGTIFLYLYWSPVSVLFFCICTDPQYRCRFSVLWCSIVISNVLIAWRAITYYVDNLTPDMLLLDICPLLWYHLSPTTCHVNTWPVIITFTRIMYLSSCVIYSDLYPQYSCTFVLLNSWTCPAPTIFINW